MAVCLLCLVLPALADDDEDENGGGNVDPGVQWRMANSYFERREYDDARAFMIQFVRANPDDNNVLEAYLRCYEIARSYRPNPELRKAIYQEALTACDRWRKKYPDTNKERAARALWYKASLHDREGARPLGISTLTELVTKLPGTQWDASAYWTLGEWLRDGQRFSEAIPNYAAYRKIAGVSEQGGLAAFREGWCYEALGEDDNALAAYRSVLNGYNFGWGQFAWGALDAARRARKLGDDQLCRTLAYKIIDGSPKEWYDLQSQARALIGEKLQAPPKNIRVNPSLNETYLGDQINLNGQSKLKLTRELPVLVRLEWVSKDDPFSGSLGIVPKIAVAKEPDNMKASEEGGKKTYRATITAPDAKGNVQRDWWYKFTEETQTVSPPDSLTVTRSWEKTENALGICTIRIQSTARWHIWITLPNNKTNVNNLNIQPHEVQNNGRTFKWHDWFDLKEGLVLKFPVEVGGGVDNFYPLIRLEHSISGYRPDQVGTGVAASYETPFFYIKLMSEKPFPCGYQFPGTRVVILNEIVN